jgi:transposase-like protein
VTNLSQERPYYSIAFKQKVLTSILSGEMSLNAARKHYKIGGSETLSKWYSKRAEIFGYNFAATMDELKKHVKQSDVSPEELKAEVSALKQLLELERAKSTGYLTMIKLAEEKLGVPIEKKFGAK